jgi:serine/threonine-protein kinase RsbT
MDNPSQSVRIRLFESGDHLHAVIEARRLAAEIGFSETDGTMIATAVSELAANIVRYAREGEVVLSIVRKEGRTGIEVVARDEGPGISDIDEAMSEEFSTGQSLGLGLPSVKRIMDEFTIESTPGHGTRVSATKWI